MRRWLTLVLLVLLPIQFTWASAAPYCQHEVTDSFHFGHHVHEHLASPSADAQGDGSQDQGGNQDRGLTVDSDCGYCQFSVVKSLPVPQLAFANVSMGSVSTMPLASFKFRAPDRLERPNWRLA